VAEPTASDAAEVQDDRSSRAVRRLVGLLALILVPAGIYAAYVIGQIDYIRRHDLRSLENATQAAQTLLETTRANVGILLEDPRDACTTFPRQNLAALVTPGCRFLEEHDSIEKDGLRLETGNGRVEIVGDLPAQGGESAQKLRVEIPLAKFLEQIPFGAAFDQMFIVDDAGALLGSAISPQRGSPMLPPRDMVRSAALPMRVLNIQKLQGAGGGKDADKKEGEKKDAVGKPTGLADATLVQSVDLGGTRYSLMCQPWRVAALSDGTDVRTWRLCGLVDGQRSFRQALEVAPQVVMLLLVLLTLALVSWPILKALSLAPRERIGFADLYLMLLSSLTLVMILAVAAADIGTYTSLRTQSRDRLDRLAKQIQKNLLDEFEQMYRQLGRYDADIAESAQVRAALPELLGKAQPKSKPKGVSIGCMLLAPAQRQAAGCKEVVLPLAVPDGYPSFESVFWMRPCDGQQIIKGTPRRANTPAVPLAAREYFQAIKQDRLWATGYLVDTSASLTTGEFFAALSMPSKLRRPGDATPATATPDCYPPEDQRFGAALSTRPIAVRFPVLAPGVGFAIADQSGRVLFHSDERRAVVAENLLADDGLADRVRAALVARGSADFDAQYQTRPYQIHILPMQGTPWSVMAFADDEILRTLHFELLAQTGILLTLYLLLAFIGTLIYILFHGRAPPIWVWPLRHAMYRPLYCGTVWTLGAQFILFLLALDALRGATLVVASMVLPVPALLTVVLAARAARRIHEDRSGAIEARQQKINAALIAMSALLWVGAFVAMDPVSAHPLRIGTQTWILVALLVVAVAAATVPKFTALKDPMWMRWWREPLGPHIIASTIVWLLLGALPAYGLYKFALGMQMTLVTKNEQAYVGRAFAWRDCQIQSDFRQMPRPADGGAALRSRIALSTDIYLATLSQDFRRDSRDVATLPTIVDRLPARQFWRYLENVAPVYNETTTYSRYLEPFTAADDPRWRWDLVRGEEPLLLYSHGKASACNDVVPALAGRLPMREPQFGAFGILLSLASLSLLLAWVSFGSRKLFFGDVDAQTTPAGRAPVGSLLQPPDPAWVSAEVAPIGSHFSHDAVWEFGDSAKYATCRAVLDSILKKVRPDYESRWQSCSDEEKLLLIQLVEEGYANPKQDEVVRRLLAAGLLRLDPVLRPMNQSFALFVAANAQPDQVRKQEHANRGMRWSLVRTLLIAALLLIMVFLALTQRDVVEVWIAYLGTAGAGTIGVLKLLSLLSKSNAPKSD
jgi:hypothetical protein